MSLLVSGPNKKDDHMSKSIIIDLTRCRECQSCKVECTYPFHPGNNGMLALLEAAVFQYTCRRCEEAPCVEVCPAEALERKTQGVVERSSNLCIACKSCVTVCPFGTLMNQFFEVRKSVCDYCHFNEDTSGLRCVETCPNGALAFREAMPGEEPCLFALNEKVWVKEVAWEAIKEKQ
jgi:Fe-S-cluster-containing dehydrogenase component